VEIAAGFLQFSEQECANMKFPRRSVLSGASLLVGAAPLSAAAKSINIRDLQGEIDRAIGSSGVLQIPAGTYATAGLKITGPLRLEGTAGHTKLISLSGGPVLQISGAEGVGLNGITFTGRDVPHTEELASSAIVEADNAKGLTIENCQFKASPFNGLKLNACSGRIVGNRVEKLGDTGISAYDSKGLEISGNDITNIGNNGIQVWRGEPGEDGTQILNNRISHVRFDSGGNGQNGNAIVVFRAGNVIAAHNRLSDLAFTGIRFNATSNSQIIGNSISRSGEKAIYSEFSFQGTVIANNVVDDAAFGIAIANFDVGGRLAICTGNIIRNIRRGQTEGDKTAWGISCDADTVISNNIIEGVDDAGINLGWGKWCRNLVASGNIVRDCDRGIIFSTVEGAGKILVTGNMITGSKLAAIQGMNYFDASTEDLALSDQNHPAHITLSANVVTA
jgi:uncharacterized secreted repeat protein (TIGR03808 family)